MSEIGYDGRGFPIQVSELPSSDASTESVSTSVTSATSTATYAAASIVRLLADADTFVVAGTTATTGGMLLKADTPEYFVMDSASKISAILASGTGTLRITAL